MDETVVETAGIRKNTLKKVISLMSLGVNLISPNPSLNVSWARCYRVAGVVGGTYQINIWSVVPLRARFGYSWGKFDLFEDIFDF